MQYPRARALVSAAEKRTGAQPGRTHAQRPRDESRRAESAAQGRDHVVPPVRVVVMVSLSGRMIIRPYYDTNRRNNPGGMASTSSSTR